MGDTTGIEWTDHTLNPWWGCVRVSPACEHCYAETFAKRFGVEWGVKAERRPASEKVWAGPVRWNKAAQKAGVRARVFCASMADVFEDRRDLDVHRERLFALIETTPWLDWQLLTKRPEAVMRLVPEAWRGSFPGNVWMGTTVEDARREVDRIAALKGIPARVRFLSCEPLLGPLAIDPWLRCPRCAYTALDAQVHMDHGFCSARNDDAVIPSFIGWVIVGGESGNGARPMDPEWARSLRDQCNMAGVPFFFKQWGEWAPAGMLNGAMRDSVSITHVGSGMVEMWRVGKKLAGSLLDGVSHKAFPA